MWGNIGEPAVDDVPLRASFPAHDAQDFEGQFDLLPHMFEVGFEGEFAVEEHTEILVAFYEWNARFGVHFLSPDLLELFERAHVQHDATFLAVNRHLAVELPIPDGLPGFQELLFPRAQNGNVICVGKDVVALLVQLNEQVIHENREESGAECSALDDPLVDQGDLVPVEHLGLPVEPFD